MSWTKEQEEAILKSGSNIIVSAGAGSGKTAVLTERVIRKIINGTSINRLLILTFTKLAAYEMKERIRTSLKKNNLIEELNLLDSSYITTFDSFALSIVKKYHTLVNVPSDISVMDSSIETYQTDLIINNLFEESYNDLKFQKLINDFCIKDDENIKEIFKIYSSKIDLIINKKDYLDNYIDIHYNDNYINDKISLYLEEISKEKENLNNLYKELIKYVDDNYIEKYNIIPLINSNNYIDIKNNLNNLGIPRKNKYCDEQFKQYKENMNTSISKLKKLTRFNDIEEIKKSILDTKDYVEVFIDLKNKFDSVFLKYKENTNQYTYNDIALMALNIIKNNDDVKGELKNSFDEIMIDEYQDTSDIQEEFINLISNNNLYMVGDIKQSIYRFRNANPYIFKDKYNKYSNNDNGIKIDLLKNFRSRQEVLDNINLIFNLIMDEEIGDANYKDSHQMNFGNLSYINENKTNQNYNMEIFNYNPKEIDKFSKDEIEAFTTAYDIKNKINNKFKVVDKKTNLLRDCKYSDFSIIMDRNTSFDLYKKIFEYLNIPLLEIKNKKLSSDYDLTVIKNLIKLIIKINLNELDMEFKHLFISISRSYLLNINDEEIFDIVNSNNYKDTKLFNICKSINILELSNIELINIIIDKFNIYEKLITISNIKESIIKLDYLKDLAINLSNIGYTPIEFSKYLDEMNEKEIIEYSLNNDDTNSVKLINIHKSKGLEYSICYFTGLDKKINDQDIKTKFVIDSNHNIITPYIDDEIKETIYKDLLIIEENKKEISELIRKFYVALTRTKEKFIIVCPLDLDKESYETLVPTSLRINYKKISDILNSITGVLAPYIRNIDFNKVILTHDYDNKKKNTINIEPSNKKINKYINNIEYNLINESRYSKKTKRLITLDEYNNMKEGIKLHYIFETENFKNTNNSYVLNFLKQIDNNYINIYKEYEFIYNDNLEEKHGFIDLMLEYNDYINIIDYKMKNIKDLEYLEQLNGYKKYIEQLTNKKTNIYLYSIIDNKLEQIK